jgi:predicted membrane chloride channel (bestrophin family)
LWDEDSLENIMMACITMHNMVVEDERDEEVDFIYDQMGEKVTVSHVDAPELDAFIAKYQKIKKTHNQLQADLVEHLWNNYLDLYNISSKSDFILCRVISFSLIETSYL